MKAVLISIKPNWCKLIWSGMKTVEVRKTRPKLETPFKVYIYCTGAGVPFACRITAAICFFSARVSLRLFPAVSRVFFVCPFDNR